MQGIGTQIIETERLILRPIKETDAAHMFRNWTSDPSVARYVTWDVHSSVEATQSYANYKAQRYNESYCFDWIIILKEIQEPIGEIEAVHVSLRDRLVEMGYCLGSSFWNKGYGSEALRAFIDYMFKLVGAEKVIACHISTNPASGQAMLKAGMAYDGTLKGYLLDKNTQLRADKVYYSIDIDQ